MTKLYEPARKGTDSILLNAIDTAALLPYAALAKEIEGLLRDDDVQVPTRLVQALPGGGSLFVMPALDRHIAITKLITFTPSNTGTGRATIQGDVVVFDIATGQRKLILDGPTVTARRSAAVSLLAAQYLAPQHDGPLLIVGAGAQGRSHLQAFVQELGVQEVVIASRSAASSRALADYAQALGARARVVSDPNEALADCPLVVTCTPASAVVLHAKPRQDCFIAAVGAFTPKMLELSPELCQNVASQGTVVLDTADARHEAGDLLQAGVDVAQFVTLRDVLCQSLPHPQGPVLFKSCGWAGWDLAAARTAMLLNHW
jgi:ornithine cyclodeaminase